VGFLAIAGYDKGNYRWLEYLQQIAAFRFAAVVFLGQNIKHRALVAGLLAAHFA
jgi:hypothetical protein